MFANQAQRLYDEENGGSLLLLMVKLIQVGLKFYSWDNSIYCNYYGT
jgi:hypothetical protein